MDQLKPRRRAKVGWWPAWFERLSHKNLARWQVALGFAGAAIGIVAIAITVYVTQPAEKPPSLEVTQQVSSITPQVVDPRMNLEVVSYSNGVARLKIRMVNEGTKPLRETYMHWAIDSTIGEVTGYPATTTATTINVGGRSLTNLVTFLQQPLYTKRSFLIWDLTVTGMRPGTYPMRFQFVTADGTFTYPPSGLSAPGWSITVPAEKPLK